MGMLETSHKFATFTSTSAAKAFNAKGYAQGLTFGLETSSGCTAAYQLLHRMGSSAGPYSVISSGTMSTGAFVTDQFMGPLEWVKPRVKTKTAGSTNLVDVFLMGN
jgi:hypothetical protein